MSILTLFACSDMLRQHRQITTVFPHTATDLRKFVPRVYIPVCHNHCENKAEDAQVFQLSRPALEATCGIQRLSAHGHMCRTWTKPRRTRQEKPRTQLSTCDQHFHFTNCYIEHSHLV